MNCTDSQGILNEWFDGELGPTEQEALRRHLADCADCRAEAAALRALLAEAAALPREIAPPHDLWAGIAERIEARRVVRVDFRRGARQALLTAAAILLIAVTSAVTAVLLRGGGGGAVAVTPPAPVRVQAPVGTAFAAFEPAEAEYESTLRTLHAAVAEGGGVLAPETMATLEANLRIIDQAIAESRAALAADPNNRDLVLMLSGVYGRKVEVLRTAVLLQAAT